MNTSSIMQAIVAAAPSGPEVRKLPEHPVPAPSAGQVLVRVLAAGVNRLDSMQRQGIAKRALSATDVLGLEACGKIVACGLGVRTWEPGMRVRRLRPLVHRPGRSLSPVPDILSDDEAGTLPEGLFAIWHNFFKLCPLKMCETVLIHVAPQTNEEKARMARLIGKHVFPLIADGRIRPRMHGSLPLAQAAEAHRMMVRGEIFGKLVLML